MSSETEDFYGPEVLGLLLTSKCNFTCRHCCNESHPHNSDTAQFDEIARLIDEACRIPSIREVGITGGEPFLFVDLIHKVVRYAAKRKLSASVTTNGFWSRSSRAPQLLGELRTDGLKSIHISTSIFHQEFLPIEAVVRAAEIALKSDLQVTVNIVTTPGLMDTVKEAFGTLVARMDFVVMPSLPAGRGGRKVLHSEFQPTFDLPLGNCRSHFSKLAIDRAGDVYPCCSPGGFTAPLRIGSVHDAPLQEIVAHSLDSRLLAILESVGPGYFLPFLRAAGLDDELPAKFIDQCHLCHAMLSSPRCAAIVLKTADRLVADLAAMPPSERPSTVGRMAKLIEFENPERASAYSSNAPIGE